MQVEFQYAYVWDLVYHMLAHMKVDNPSDLYAEEYIERIRLEKKEQYPGFMPEESFLLIRLWNCLKKRMLFTEIISTNLRLW